MRFACQHCKHGMNALYIYLRNILFNDGRRAFQRHVMRPAPQLFCSLGGLSEAQMHFVVSSNARLSGVHAQISCETCITWMSERESVECAWV